MTATVLAYLPVSRLIDPAALSIYSRFLSGNGWLQDSDFSPRSPLSRSGSGTQIRKRSGTETSTGSLSRSAHELLLKHFASSNEALLAPRERRLSDPGSGSISNNTSPGDLLA